MPTIQHPDPALSIGFEIISLPDQAVQISSFTNVAQQQQSMSHMPRANVYVLSNVKLLILFSHSNFIAHRVEKRFSKRETANPQNSYCGQLTPSQ
jgi:hypothetical protein